MDVARCGSAPSVARRNGTGATPSGSSHGSSIENMARGIDSVAACISGRIISPHPGGITRATTAAGTMVDPELDELRREFLAEADEKVREIEAKVADHSPASIERLAYLAHQL